MRPFETISDQQNLAFGNTEKSLFLHFQNINNQHWYCCIFSSTFTGKEKDPETGYSYFGARYLDHELMTMWLSVDPMADKYPSISPYAYCAWNPVKLVDPDGRDGEAIVDKNKNTIDITMRFYYNKNDEKLQKYVFGMNPYEESQIEKDKENGFGSQKWSVVDYNDKEWTVSFSIEYVALESDEEVKKALGNDPMANALIFDPELAGKSAGKWDPNSRTVAIGPGSIDNFHLDYAGTLTHEMGHALGLPDSDSFAEVGNSLHKAEKLNYGIMSYSIGRKILPHELQYGVNRIVKEANISTNNIVRLHVFGSLIRKPSVIQ